MLFFYLLDEDVEEELLVSHVVGCISTVVADGSETIAALRWTSNCCCWPDEQPYDKR